MYVEITDFKKINDLPGYVMSAQELIKQNETLKAEAEKAKRRRHKSDDVKVEKKKEWSVDEQQEVVYIYNYKIQNGELFKIDCNWEDTTNP